MSNGIFDGLSPAEVKAVKAAGTPVSLPQGWSPISERTPADKAYILLDGTVSVRRGGKEIATLGPGDIIGEAAIVGHTLRTASIVAVTPLELLHYSDAKLEELAAKHTTFGDNLRAIAQARRASDEAAEG